MKISLIQPSRNNLKYLKWSYDSIRKNQGDHEVEICVADDASTDGTDIWCKEMAKSDPNFKWIRNSSGTRLGHTILYDRLINEVATSDICMIYHADMYLCPGALTAIEKNISENIVVSLTRIEPPLHPPGPEKILLDWGATEPENFDETRFLNWFNSRTDVRESTNGIFAPWAIYKKKFQEIGGHDPLFAPQSKEDSDIFNRFKLNGMEFIQTGDGYVYHMTCRGSRFNPSITKVGVNSNEWDHQNIKSSRNFIRKWGSFVSHDNKLHPIIPPKYNVAFAITNCSPTILGDLEPWCSTIYVDLNSSYIEDYINLESKNTKFNMRDRVKPISELINSTNDVIVKFDASKITKKEHSIFLTNFGTILKMSGEIGEMQHDIFTVSIRKLNTYEHELIKLNV